MLASYGDTKIQEFFIENTYPERAEILKLYEHLYHSFEIGEGTHHQILKTQTVLAREAGLASDLQAGTILKIFEKYGIVTTGVESIEAEDFRGKGVTLLLPKVATAKVPIDWSKQDLLKNESYFKLEQIKKLLFSPNCRKRFILEYFGDEEDLASLGESCGVCDYCIDRQKFANGDFTNLVQLSVFEIVLDAVGKYSQKFGVNLFAIFLMGASDSKIRDRNMESDEYFGILQVYSTELVVSVIESLIRSGYLEKTEGMYPLLSITDKGKFSSRREALMKQEETELQSYVALKARNSVFKKGKSKKGKSKESDKEAKSSLSGVTSKKRSTGDTYRATLELFQAGYSLKDIATERGMTPITIESHLVKLYEKGEIDVDKILELTQRDHIQQVQQLVQKDFTDGVTALRPVKDRLEEMGFSKISYFEIKLALSMIEKRDFIE